MPKVDHRTGRAKIFITTVDPQHRYSNEADKANGNIYDDFKLKKNICILDLYLKICVLMVKKRLQIQMQQQK